MSVKTSIDFDLPFDKLPADPRIEPRLQGPLYLLLPEVPRHRFDFHRDSRSLRCQLQTKLHRVHPKNCYFQNQLGAGRMKVDLGEDWKRSVFVLDVWVKAMEPEDLLVCSWQEFEDSALVVLSEDQ